MLSRYIRDLLFQHKSVIVPDFGAFITEEIPSYIDEENKVIVPPSKKLNFNPDITEDDTVLVNYIASQDHISQESAQNFVKFKIAEWKELLNTRDLDVEGIGTFSLDPNGFLQFDPKKWSNFSTESFGLDPVELPGVPVADLKNELVGQTIPQPKKRKRKQKTSWTSYLVYALLFLTLAALGWFFSLKIKENNMMYKEAKAGLETQDELIKQHLREAVFEIKDPLRPVTLKVLINPAIDSVVTPQTEAGENTSVQESSASQTGTIPANTKKELLNSVLKNPDSVVLIPVKRNNPDQIAENASKFYIIAGVFKDPDNAINKVRDLKKKGYNALIVNREANLIQVSYGYYETKANAERDLLKIQKENPDAWILGK